MPATQTPATKTAALNIMLDSKAILEESKAAMRSLHVAFLSGRATTADVKIADSYLKRDQAAYDKALANLAA